MEKSLKHKKEHHHQILHIQYIKIRDPISGSTDSFEFLNQINQK